MKWIKAINDLSKKRIETAVPIDEDAELLSYVKENNISWDEMGISDEYTSVPMYVYDFYCHDKSKLDELAKIFFDE